MSGQPDPAREAAAAAVLDELGPGQVIALGSGRAVWRVLELMAERWPDGLRVVVASDRTQERAVAAGMEVLELDGSVEPSVAIDGADEVGPGLALIKGGGGALLREKIVIASAARFVVVAETAKRVDRLGQGFKLPVEVVRFGWQDTARRLDPLVDGWELREDDGEPYDTDEGHLILDCGIPEGAEPEELAAELSMTPGVVEHGLFIGMAETAYLGTPQGDVEILEP
jgi:ribose 5-phosphate isomerase A